MADNNFQALRGQAEQDELDKILAARPKTRAPRQTAANVMALLAALPENKVDTALTPRYSAPVVNVDFSPLAEPLFESAVAFVEPDLNDSVQRGQLIGRVLAGLLAGFVTLLSWLIWPAISNLVFGPSNDPELQARLAFLQRVGDNIVSGFISFFVQYGAIMPTILSLVLGLSIMTTLIVNNRYRSQNLGF